MLSDDLETISDLPSDVPLPSIHSCTDDMTSGTPAADYACYSLPKPACVAAPPVSFTDVSGVTSPLIEGDTQIGLEARESHAKFTSEVQTILKLKGKTEMELANLRQQVAELETTNKGLLEHAAKLQNRVSTLELETMDVKDEGKAADKARQKAERKLSKLQKLKGNLSRSKSQGFAPSTQPTTYSPSTAFLPFPQFSRLSRRQLFKRAPSAMGAYDKVQDFETPIDFRVLPSDADSDKASAEPSSRHAGSNLVTGRSDGPNLNATPSTPPEVSRSTNWQSPAKAASLVRKLLTPKKGRFTSLISHSSPRNRNSVEPLSPVKLPVGIKSDLEEIISRKPIQPLEINPDSTPLGGTNDHTRLRSWDGPDDNRRLSAPTMPEFKAHDAMNGVDRRSRSIPRVSYAQRPADNALRNATKHDEASSLSHTPKFLRKRDEINLPLTYKHSANPSVSGRKLPEHEGISLNVRTMNPSSHWEQANVNQGLSRSSVRAPRRHGTQLPAEIYQSSGLAGNTLLHQMSTPGLRVRKDSKFQDLDRRRQHEADKCQPFVQLSDSHPRFSFESATPFRAVNSETCTQKSRTSRSTEVQALKGILPRHSKVFPDGLALSTPARQREQQLTQVMQDHMDNIALEGKEIVRLLALCSTNFRTPKPSLSSDGPKLMEEFHLLLGDISFNLFQRYVHRYDSGMIPLDGPSGLLIRVRKLIEQSIGCSLSGQSLSCKLFSPPSEPSAQEATSLFHEFCQFVRDSEEC